MANLSLGSKTQLEGIWWRKRGGFQWKVSVPNENRSARMIGGVRLVQR